ncbi:hypothetical protein ACI6QG_13780 [Roseococcus sp. DSY-14]|uniref:hypothetical protein n=1 Tax=Roseococcus sp. DSY-14 TaxID=3369650 RepID=UPI00387B5E61
MDAAALELAATRAALESLHGTMAIARALVLAGREVDLTGLDGDAGRLCAAIACLPPGAGAQLHLPLLELTEELDRLRRALEDA